MTRQEVQTRVAEIRARLREASRGPWRLEQDQDGDINIRDADGEILFSDTQYYPIAPYNKADLELTSYAYEDLEFLIRELEERL